MAMNQIAITGPKNAATLAVPWRWTANRASRIAMVIGRTKCSSCGAASLRPSTAERTEIAGVITESPRNMEAPITPSMNTNVVRRPMARVASAVSDRVPPSPLLSARSRMSTYFRVTTMISAHRIIDRTPSTLRASPRRRPRRR